MNPEKEAIKQQYPGIASGVRKKEHQQIQLHIHQNVVPAVQYQRKLAFSQKPKVEAKIWKMLDKNIIEPATGPTTWVNPIVVVPKYSNTGKSDDIRICIDMRRTNEAIMGEQHPIPTIDEVLQDMNGSKYFSQLDLRWGYNQLELSPEIRDITTFVTHFGLFRFKRLIFGINAASEMYQNEIQSIIRGVPGVANISDNITVHVRMKEEHDERLHEVLRRLHQAGLTLNMEKNVILMWGKWHSSEIAFLVRESMIRRKLFWWKMPENQKPQLRCAAF